MKPYVLILCANLKGNLGDYAILEAMIRALGSRYAGMEVRFYAHGNKSIDKQRMTAFQQGLDVEYTYLGGSPHFRRPRLLRMFRKQLDACGLGAGLHMRSVRRCASSLLQTPIFVSEVSSAEAVYFAGGAQWGRGDLNLNMFAQLLAASDLNPNVFCFPFSVSEGVLECCGEENSRRLFARLSQPVPVRDVVSYERLTNVEVEVELRCDCVFSLVSDLPGQSVASPKTNRVFVAVTGSGGLTPQQCAAFLQAIRTAGYEPVLFSSCAIEDSLLYEVTRSLCGVELVYPHSWREAVSILGSAAFVVTNRLHCMIFSALADSAVIPVTNRSKARGYYKDAGLPSFLPSLSDVGAGEIARLAQSAELARQCQKVYLKRCRIELDELFDSFSRFTKTPSDESSASLE